MKIFSRFGSLTSKEIVKGIMSLGIIVFIISLLNILYSNFYNELMVLDANGGIVSNQFQILVGRIVYWVTTLSVPIIALTGLRLFCGALYKLLRAIEIYLESVDGE